jgi:flagellar protein FliJ
MKKFVFRFETLLKHRRNIEEREQEKFTRIRSEMLAEIARQDALIAEQNQTRKQLVSLQSSGCDLQEIQWCYAFIDYLDQELKKSIGRLIELEKKIEEQRRIMVAASRDKKIIENLKSKRTREYLISSEREEQRNLDEIVVTRFAVKP